MNIVHLYHFDRCIKTLKNDSNSFDCIAKHLLLLFNFFSLFLRLILYSVGSNCVLIFHYSAFVNAEEENKTKSQLKKINKTCEYLSNAS